MDNQKPDVAYVKQRLVAYRESDRYIDNLIERQERIEAQLYGIGSPVISDMPRGGTSSGPDRFTVKLAKLDELREKVRDRIKERDDERHYFEKLLSKVKSANQVSVIEMRYFDAMSWEEVNESIFGRKEDFDDRRESYMRRIVYMHGDALAALAELMSKCPE